MLALYFWVLIVSNRAVLHRVTTITCSIEKILAAKKLLQPPTTLVPKVAGNQQLSKHVCHDMGISFSFAWMFGTRLNPRFYSGESKNEFTGPNFIEALCDVQLVESDVSI